MIARIIFNQNKSIASDEPLVCRRVLMLDTNCLQTEKELVKVGIWWNFRLFGCNIRGEVGFQKLQIVWVAKALVSSDSSIFFKRLSTKSIHYIELKSLGTVTDRASLFQFSELINVFVASSITLSLMLLISSYTCMLWRQISIVDNIFLRPPA